MKHSVSPCLNCTRVANPRDCENKNCQAWRNHFLRCWENMRAMVRAEMERTPEAVGVTVSGKTYAAPHQVENYLATDPCTTCLCPKELCAVPCRLKRNWRKAREDVLL